MIKLLIALCLPLLFLIPGARKQENETTPAIIFLLGLLIFLLYVNYQVNE